MARMSNFASRQEAPVIIRVRLDAECRKASETAHCNGRSSLGSSALSTVGSNRHPEGKGRQALMRRIMHLASSFSVGIQHPTEGRWGRSFCSLTSRSKSDIAIEAFVFNSLCMLQPWVSVTTTHVEPPMFPRTDACIASCCVSKIGSARKDSVDHMGRKRFDFLGAALAHQPHTDRVDALNVHQDGRKPALLPRCYAAHRQIRTYGMRENGHNRQQQSCRGPPGAQIYSSHRSITACVFAIA